MRGVTIKGDPVPQRGDAEDLGSHINYTRQWRNQGVQKRIDKTKEKLTRLGHMPLGVEQKARLVRQGCLPQAPHGTEGTIVGQKHIDGLRTAITRALRPRGKGPA